MTNETLSFFDQLKQRHVFRVAAMYCVIVWLLMQLGSVVFEPLGFPTWSQKALIIVVAIGFPIALVLAWVFDVTPHGIVVTDAGSAPRLSRGRKLDIVIIVGLLAALAVTFVWRPAPNATSTMVQDSSIVVLPFVAMSEDASLRHRGEGLSEQITNELAARSELRVVSRTSAFEQAGKDAVAIAHNLGVSYVLEGSVRPSGAQVRVTAQLVRGEDGIHVWSDTYDVVEADAAAWDQTAASVAVNAGSYMALERDLRRARSSTSSADAYDHYAEARRLNWQLNTNGTSTPKPWDRIVEEADRAIALDPNFVAAHVLRTVAFSNKLGRGGACGSRCIIEARRSIDRARALQPDNPGVLLALGFIQLRDELDPAAAEATFERVRQIDPAMPSLNEGFASLAAFRGNGSAARDYMVREIEISPYVAAYHALYATLLVDAGDLERAEREARSALRLAQKGEAFGMAGIHLSMLMQLGEIDKAKAEFAPLWAATRYTHPELLGRELALLGDQQEARKLAARLSQNPDVDPFFVSMTYYGLGQYDDALVWFRRMVDGRTPWVVCTLRLNQFPGLQEQPGYAELLKYLDSIQRSR